MPESLSRLWRAARDVFAGILDLHAYERYVDHCRRHHPDIAVPSRQEFYRRDLVERWDGVRRCC